MTLRERFAEIILNGRSRENILVSSLVDTMADGTFTNSNTEAMFQHYSRGFADGLASITEDLEQEPQAPAPEREACPSCKDTEHYDGLECSACGFWNIPF